MLTVLKVLLRQLYDRARSYCAHFSHSANGRQQFKLRFKLTVLFSLKVIYQFLMSKYVTLLQMMQFKLE